MNVGHIDTANIDVLQMIDHVGIFCMVVCVIIGEHHGAGAAGRIPDVRETGWFGRAAQRHQQTTNIIRCEMLVVGFAFRTATHKKGPQQITWWNVFCPLH